MLNFPYGAHPTKPDNRDYDFHKTFGTVNATVQGDFNLDVSLGFPDQEKENDTFLPAIPPLPEGCTGYTTTEICQDKDHIKYRPDFTYNKTLFLENEAFGQPCQIRDSLNSAIVYGLQAQGETTDAQALSHRAGQYFNVRQTTDWFDGFISAMAVGQNSISLGSPFFPEWKLARADGIIPQTNYNQNLNVLPWHNYKICGKKTINSVPYLIAKTWQGSYYGDGGFSYYSRNDINSIMAIGGTAAFTIAKADSSNIANVRLTLIETLLMFYYRLEALLS
jgi:hypothetical protein